jgi:hypothetical protein
MGPNRGHRFALPVKRLRSTAWSPAGPVLSRSRQLPCYLKASYVGVGRTVGTQCLEVIDSMVALTGIECENYSGPSFLDQGIS